MFVLNEIVAMTSSSIFHILFSLRFQLMSLALLYEYLLNSARIPSARLCQSNQGARTFQAVELVRGARARDGFPPLPQVVAPAPVVVYLSFS